MDDNFTEENGSKRTQAGRIPLFAWLSIGCLAALGAARVLHSAEMEDAYKDLNQSRNQYFDALVTGPQKSAVEIRSLRHQFFDAPTSRLQTLENQKWQDAQQAFTKALMVRASPRPSGRVPEPASSPLPEVVIDGSQFPKEVDFAGKPSKPSKPPKKEAPKPVPTPLKTGS